MISSENKSLLREINFGIRENLPSHFTTADARAYLVSQKGVEEDSIVDTAETAADILDRQRELFKALATHLPAAPVERHVKFLCVSHGGFIRNLVNHHCNQSLTTIKNCSVTVIEFSWDANACLTGAVPVRINDTSHLE